MKRYQVYLNPHSVSILDDFENYTNISRSKLIREAIDRLAENLARIFMIKKESHQEKLILDSLVGFIDIKSPNPTNYALKEDTTYLHD